MLQVGHIAFGIRCIHIQLSSLHDENVLIGITNLNYGENLKERLRAFSLERCSFVYSLRIYKTYGENVMKVSSERIGSYFIFFVYVQISVNDCENILFFKID